MCHGESAGGRDSEVDLCGGGERKPVQLDQETAFCVAVDVLPQPSHDPGVGSTPESKDPRAGPKARARFLPLVPPYCTNDIPFNHRPCHDCEFHVLDVLIQSGIQGTHSYIPKCHMLEQARKHNSEVQPERICTHLCKIFSKEAMGWVGITIAFEPHHSNGSCAVRLLTRRCWSGSLSSRCGSYGDMTGSGLVIVFFFGTQIR